VKRPGGSVSRERWRRGVNRARSSRAETSNPAYWACKPGWEAICGRHVVFLDRALPDSLSFYRIAGRDPNDILAECLRSRYASVSILGQLPFELDGTRVEDDAFKALLDEWLTRDYSALGYDIVRVPVLPPQERIEFLLATLSKCGLL
jgi:hypothetical protein